MSPDEFGSTHFFIFRISDGMGEVQWAGFGRKYGYRILPFGFAYIIDLQPAEGMSVMKFGRVRIQAPGDVPGAVHVVINVDI